MTPAVAALAEQHPTYHAIQAPGTGRWHVFRESPGVSAVVHPIGFSDREEARAAMSFLAAAQHCCRCGAPCRNQFSRLDGLGTDLCLGSPRDPSHEYFTEHILPGKGTDFGQGIRFSSATDLRQVVL